MLRIASFAAWVLGAATLAAVYWYVVVYLLGEFNHGYGRDNWFALNLYLSGLSLAVGLAGYAAVAFFYPSRRALLGACLAGLAFTLADLVLVFILGRAFPDRDILAHRLVGAPVIGALTFLLRRPAV